MAVVDRIVENAERLTATERKIAEILAAEPQTVAFGTVAQVARRAGTSGPSVVRLAVKLGYEGFVDLQSTVQSELAKQLGTARDRIRDRPPDDLLARAQEIEPDNVARTLHDLDRTALERCAALLADPDRAVWVLPGVMTAPVGEVLWGQLTDLRERVHLLEGSDVAVGRAVAGLDKGDALVAIDFRRYERTVVSTTRWAIDHGAAVVAVTDGPLSPLASGATECFFMWAQGVGPFDSMTGGVAIANVIAAAVAARLRDAAPPRLDAIEAAWSATAALVGDPGNAQPPTADGNR